jgi:RNA polymerase sigma factor (sigma-70 family)
MESGISTFGEMLSRLRRKDQDAAAEIFHRFYHQLVRLAASQIVGKMRIKVPPEDLVQSVFFSFFQRVPAEAYKLDSWGGIWALLFEITLGKCNNLIRSFLTKKRNIKREVSESPHSEDELRPILTAIDREPTPMEAAMCADLVAQLLDGLDETARAIAELLLQAFSDGEIASRLNYSKRTIVRQKKRIRARLVQLGALEVDDHARTADAG